LDGLKYLRENLPVQTQDWCPRETSAVSPGLSAEAAGSGLDTEVPFFVTGKPVPFHVCME
jgi:hypothetical protein